MAKGKNDVKKRAFIAAYRVCLNVRSACEAVKIRPHSHYDWLRDDAVYRKAWAGVQEQIPQALEDEAIRRAYEGVKRVLYYKGKPIRTGRGRNARIAYETLYDTPLLIALLKRFRPDLYREHMTTEVTGSIDLVERLQAGRARLQEMRKNEQPDRATG